MVTRDLLDLQDEMVVFDDLLDDETLQTYIEKVENDETECFETEVMAENQQIYDGDNDSLEGIEAIAYIEMVVTQEIERMLPLETNQLLVFDEAVVMVETEVIEVNDEIEGKQVLVYQIHDEVVDIANLEMFDYLL